MTHRSPPSMYVKSLFGGCVVCENTHNKKLTISTISKCETQWYLVNSVLCNYQHYLVPEHF